MAAALSRAGDRLFRTYGAAGDLKPQPRPRRAAAHWFPPQDRKRFFSSSSGSGSDTSHSGSWHSVVSDDSDDPDFRGSPVRPRRGRSGGRTPKAGPSPVVTRRGLRLRARRPQKCSTPCSPLGPPPPFPDRRPGQRSPELSVCSQPRDGDALGTSASLFSSPASPSGPGTLALDDSVIYVRPMATQDEAPGAPRDFHGSAAAPLDPARRPCSRKTAAARQGRATVRSALFSLADSGDPEDSSLGADGRTRRASSRRGQRGNWPQGLGVSSTRRKRAAAAPPSHGNGSQEAVQIEDEAPRGGKGRRTTPRAKRPQRAGRSQKRKHGEVATTSLPAHSFKKDQRMKRDSFLGQNLTQSQDSSWTQTRASFSLHKKKIVTALPEVYSNTTMPSSPSQSFLSEYSHPPAMNRTGQALSPWLSSSMHLLSPVKTPRVVHKKASDAEKVYGECNQEGPIPFNRCLSREKLEHCEKIGEGVFGEVFQTIANDTPVALKIIAIEGQDLVNGSHQKTFEEILPEIIISKELSLLSAESSNRTEGFIGLHSVHCVQGSYPLVLLRAWDHYHTAKGSLNDRPDFFGEGQLFIVLEFEFGGTDLEQMRKKLASMATAKSILHQITASLAVAEAALHFEHRDLHWGNVLLKKTNHKELQYTLNGKTSTIPTRGVHVNIIDYTLSRLERDGIVVFCDISMDEDLFTGEGDYQYEIYRLMKKETNNYWGEYHPYNNVLWLHYLTDKILKQMTFKTKTRTSALKQVKQEIQHFHATMLSFSSATELLCQHQLFQ
ncbi:serine/threonine-protein kinase haspin [Echinops telfairi]|uniref:non-specific serine/threonine protein kinase n=1 Tax=Echinops telfairi TaxID=9371 RepID=A0ABM0J6V4_ECHTE|nr:serine/threonine-protein kinase haspin [Echinops telfairi]